LPTRAGATPKDDGDATVFSMGKKKMRADVVDAEFGQRAEVALAREEQSSFPVVVRNPEIGLIPVKVITIQASK
jgi:hypothetical protein